MRPTLRQLAAAAVIIVGGLFTTAAIKPQLGLGGVTASGHQLGYRPGGADAGWDTVVVVFSPEARAIIAGADTVAYPGSPSALDQRRIHRLNDIIRGRGASSWRDDNADTARYYRLGTGFDVPTFAYGNIDTLTPGGYAHASATQILVTSDAVWKQDDDGGGTNPLRSFLQLNHATANKKAVLVYIPVENFIPAGATIVSAMFNYAASTGFYMMVADTMVTTLMTNTSDDKWYTQKGITSRPDWAETSWQRQWEGFWGGTDANPWVPAMSDRKYLWQFGKVSDWTGGRKPANSPSDSTNAFISAQDMVWVAATNCVQAAVNGEVNNGVLMTYHDSAEATSTGQFYHWDDFSSVTGRTPFLVVKYITKRYRQPFGTSDIAFMFATDDGKYPANSVYADTFEAHGAKFTVNMAQAQVSSGSGASTPAQLLSFRTRGHEVASHSRFHKLLGLSHYERKDATFSSDDWDSLLIDSSPQWMYDMADTVVGDLRDDPYYAKSLALPNNADSPTVMKAIAYHDYVTMRGNGLTAYNTRKYYRAAAYAPARADSIMLGATRKDQRGPRNMVGVPPFESGATMFGIKGNAHTTQGELDSVKVNFRRALFQVRGDGRQALYLFTHDLKTGASAAYTDGVNGNELGAALDVVDEFGGRIMMTSEYGRWIQAMATPIATPAAFAQPDSFKFTAQDRVWFKPHGVDNRWIPGVK